MKFDAFFLDELSEDDLATMRRLCAEESNNFNNLANLCGLNPRFDFRFANLNGVDMSNSDLRNHDFTGADLRNSFGSNVTWDSTTTLKDASVDGSMFAHYVAQNSFFARNRSTKSFADSLNKQYYMDVVHWALHNLKRDSNSDRLFFIASDIVSRNRMLFVKSHTLLFMSRLFKNKTRHKDFILYLLSKTDQDKAVIIACLRTLGDLYLSDKLVYDIIKTFSNHKEIQIRSLALSTMISSRFIFDDISYVIPCLKKAEKLRRMLVGRISSRLNLSYATMHVRGGLFVDYAEPLTMELIKRIVDSSEVKEAMRSDGALTYELNGQIVKTNQYPSKEDRIVFVLKAYMDLKEQGIPFSFDPEVRDFLKARSIELR